MNVPPHGSPWQAVSRFALSWNGYERSGGSEGAAAIGNGLLESWKREGVVEADLPTLRTALFYEQRRWRHFGEDPDDDASSYINALLTAIIEQTGGEIEGPTDALP